MEKLQKPLLFLIFHHSEESSHLQVTLALKEWACSFFYIPTIRSQQRCFSGKVALMKPRSIIHYSARSVCWEMCLFYSWDCSMNHVLWNKRFTAVLWHRWKSSAQGCLTFAANISNFISTSDPRCLFLQLRWRIWIHETANNFNNVWKLVILKVTYSRCNSKPVR